MADIVWDDFEKNQYGVARGGASGTYGDMPPELHLKKLEQTCMFEREDQLDDFFRSTLKDRTPDQVSMAQDLPRETQNQIRSEVLNLRHSAARTPAEPVHPDLFLGFTERDTRGYQNSGPDFKNTIAHSNARVKYKDFVSDHASDWTIPEGTRSDLRSIKDLRATIDISRDRMKIFETARDNMISGRRDANISSASRVPQATMDGVMLDINNAQEMNQRKDNTKLKSDTIMVGYRTTGDHKFSVAQYGITRHGEHSSNAYDNRQQSNTTHKFDVSPSEVKNRLSINIIKEVHRRKDMDVYKKDMAHNFKESVNNTNSIKKLVADLSTTQRGTKQTADMDELGYMSANAKKVKVYDPVAHDTVIVDKNIFDKVKEHKNITFVKRTDGSLRREVKAREGWSALPGDDVQVNVYSRKNPQFNQHLPTKLEHVWGHTDFSPMYKNNHQKYTGLDASYTTGEQGVDPHTDKVFNRYASGERQPWKVQQGIDSDVFNDNPMSDTVSTDISSRRMSGRSRIK